MRFKYLLLLFMLANGKLHAQSNSGFTNPIVREMNPDPSICRVNDDFYPVTSTMYFYPGIPVYIVQSTELHVKALQIFNWFDANFKEMMFTDF